MTRMISESEALTVSPPLLAEARRLKLIAAREDTRPCDVAYEAPPCARTPPGFGAYDPDYLSPGPKADPEPTGDGRLLVAIIATSAVIMCALAALVLMVILG